MARRRPIVNQPINTNRPLIAERTVPHIDRPELRFGRTHLARANENQYEGRGLYAHMVMMLPSAYDRYVRYMRGRSRRVTLERIIDRDDVLEITFRPLTGNQAPLTYEASRTALITTLTQVYGLPRDIASRLFIEVGFVREDEQYRTLGGQSVVERSFASLDDVDFEDILDIIAERGYVSVEFNALQFTFQFRVLDVLQNATRGGCCWAYDKTLTPWHLPLSKYDDWTHGQRMAFGKVAVANTPDHLIGIRGLWLGPRNVNVTHDYKLCGVESFLYGVEECKRLRGEDNDTVLFYQNPEVLEEKAVKIAEEYGFESGMCNADFRFLVNNLYPEYAVFVHDYRLLPLFHFKGPLYVDLGREPFGEGKLTASILKRSLEYRINIFLDLEKQHYFPIFSIRLFFNPLRPKKKEIDSMVDVLSSQLHGNRDQKKKVNLRASMLKLPCPYCHHRVVPNSAQHTCRVDRCVYCEKTFSSKKAYDLHMRKQGVWNCFGCLTELPNQACYQDHVVLCVGVCHTRCPYCHKYYKMHEQHVCKKYICSRCREMVLDPWEYDDCDKERPYRRLHRCALKGAKSLGKNKETYPTENGALYYAFDFESMLETCEHATLKTVLEDGVIQRIPIYRHTVNYAYAMCINGNDTLPSSVLEFEVTSMAEFWRKVLEVTKEHRTVWYAHNLKGYDGRLLLDYLESIDLGPCSLLQRGDKVLSMSIRHPEDEKKYIAFKDSLLHIAAPLSAIPKMFGLDTRVVKKGMFPYLFNTPENQNYVGPVPDKRYFEPDMMSEEKRAEFLTWHRNKRRNKRYDLQEELRKYCKNDVLILKLGLLEYSKVCSEYGHRDPLRDMTIAQYTYNVYRENNMPDNTLYYLDKSQVDFARRSLHGGKTDIRWLFYEQSEEDKNDGAGLRYVDIQSLYPTVQFYDEMPTGQPETYRFDDHNQPPIEMLLNFFGFIECDIHPARYLHHPLLCDYRDKKLMAHLYPLKKVVITSAEFGVAIREAGYKCTYVYRIDVYKPNSNLFKDFIRNWLKLKIVSGKCPFQRDDESSFLTYQKELETRLGIQLSREDFKENTSLRTLAKMVLNSLWGKFGQRDVLVKTKVLETSADLLKYHERKRHGLVEERYSRCFGTCKQLKKYVQTQGISTKNVAVAAFVTAHARIRLWRELNRLWDRVYYHDTDSIIYYYNPKKDWYNIPEGSFLGDWESETGASLIHSFVGLAPKTYAYRYIDETGKECEVVKAKGFSTSTKQGIEKFNYQTYRALVMGEIKQLTLTQRVFQHVYFPEPAMITYDAEKTMQFHYGKGVVDKKTLRVFPFGYELFLRDSPITPLFDVSLSAESEGSEREPEIMDEDAQALSTARFLEQGYRSYTSAVNNDIEGIEWMLERIEAEFRGKTIDQLTESEKEALQKQLTSNYDEQFQTILHYHRLRLEMQRQLDPLTTAVDEREELLKSIDAYCRVVGFAEENEGWDDDEDGGVTLTLSGNRFTELS